MLAFILSLVATFIITPFVINLSYRRGFLDYPKQKSIHVKPMPMLGGAVLFFVFFLSSFFLGAHFNLIPLFLAAIPVFAGGIYDDIKGMSAGWKLSIQFISIVVLMSFGVLIKVVRVPYGPLLYLGSFSIPVTIIWFLFILNLVNLLDGLDGLASGLCVIAFIFILVTTPTSLFDNQLIILIGSTLAFLVFNFNPAKVFLGNNGSAFLGLMVGYFSLVTSQKSTVMPTLIIPLVIFLIQIFDMGIAVFRRLKSGANIFRGDKYHIHHLALNIVKSHRSAVLIFYLFSLICAFISLKFFT